MSCQSCSGCFTGSSCSTPKPLKKNALVQELRFQSLLDLAATTPDNNDSQQQHDHVIPTIMAELSKNVYSSQTVLFKANDELPLNQFLSLAKALYSANIVGVHIAWAAEFCQDNVQQLLDILTKGDPTALLQHCDDQAEVYELFGQLPPGSVGRIASVKE
ncbi:uncharacterized protein B0P05DRAFT_539768 [Gilbertella persicaria]|uniref:uncharacterized protein n=1 Tax=Gilbertella persicaria TaxID=101096 RepID=UPI00221F93F0|nr:uncharacterized protein B0P05DRAFT_539768 [Gilbertella persicaria]KAI8080826.1 hypothetical protein B0P05DRAFT_539768 [Gilbertella persicaria]